MPGRFLLVASTLAILARVAQPASAQTVMRVTTTSGGVQANDQSFLSALSSDGRAVAFVSGATNLAADGAAVGGVFVWDRLTGAFTRVSVASTGAPALGAPTDYTSVAISWDGRIIAFDTPGSDLVLGDTNGRLDVFVRDRIAGITERASVSSSGQQSDGDSESAALSADGRFVAFTSRGTNLVPGGRAHQDVFVRDRSSRTTERVSVDSRGIPGDRRSGEFGLSISASGRYVVFESAADDLVAGDTNGLRDVFLRDRLAGVTERVSGGASGGQGDGNSFLANRTSTQAVSEDGSVVVFSSTAANLVPGDTNGTTDVFVRDRAAGVTERVSVSGSGAEGNGASGESGVSVSADGRYVVFESEASNLVPGDRNGMRDVFIHDRQTGETARVSVDSIGREANAPTGSLDLHDRPALSALGRFVAFSSAATNLVGQDTNGVRDVFLHDRSTCRAGSVNAGAGSVVDVLLVNGIAGAPDTRLVSVGAGMRIEVALHVASAGPSPARYVLWVWRGLPANQLPIAWGGERIGCAVNPTPLAPFGNLPQPLRCVDGGLGAEFVGSVSRFESAPASAPWTLVRNHGFTRQGIYTMQGFIEDAAADNAQHLSATNAIVVHVQ